MLQKVTLRREILSPNGMEFLGGKPEACEVEEKVEPQISEVPEVKVVVPKTWDGFLSHLKTISPATLSNLEQGNLSRPISTQDSNLVIELAYPEEASLFKNFLEDKEVYQRLIEYISEYFEVEKELVKFRTVLISMSDESNQGFKTRAQLAEEEKKKAEDERRTKVSNHPTIKGAEKLFNARIDKINLN